MSWIDGWMMGLDLETTSADPEEARIVQAALPVVGQAEPGKTRDVAKMSWLVNPGVEIPQGAIDVHGITNERITAEGRPASEVLPEIMRRVCRAQEFSMPVVIQNAPYDLTVLDRELRRHGIGGGDVLSRLLVFDPLAIDRHLDRYRSKTVARHTLEGCCQVWNVPLDGVAHDASFDAIAACRLAWRLVKNGYVKRRKRGQAEYEEWAELTAEWERVKDHLVDLQDYQRDLHAADMEQLEAWLRRGDPRKDVPPQPDRVLSRDWPIIPLRVGVPA